MANLLWWALAIVLLGGLAIPVAYLVVRGASIGYFRTKLEFMRKARNVKHERKTNGV